MPDIFIPTNQTPQESSTASTTVSGNVPLPLLNRGRHPIHAFSSYTEMPIGVSFGTQESDETILLFLRQDFATNIPWISASILLLFAPFLISYIAAISQSPFLYFPPNFFLVIRIFYYLIIGTYIFVNFITWYFNVSLITTKRVIDVDFADLIYKNVAGTKLSLVQDVSFTQVGAIRAVFDFGDVLIQTAGAVDNFELHAIPKPERTVQIVEDLLGKEETNVP